MQLKAQSGVSRPALLDTGSGDDLDALVDKLAMAKNAIGALRRVEGKILAEESAGGLSPQRLNLGKQEMAKFAGIIEKSAKDAIAISKRMKAKLKIYQKDLANATD